MTPKTPEELASLKKDELVTELIAMNNAYAKLLAKLEESPKEEFTSEEKNELLKKIADLEDQVTELSDLNAKLVSEAMELVATKPASSKPLVTYEGETYQVKTPFVSVGQKTYSAAELANNPQAIAEILAVPNQNLLTR